MNVPGPVATRATAAAHDVGMEKETALPDEGRMAAAWRRKLRQQASDLPLVSSMDWRGVQRRMRAQAHARRGEPLRADGRTLHRERPVGDQGCLRSTTACGGDVDLDHRPLP